MKYRMLILTAFFLAALSVAGFSYEMPDIGFPFKGFIYSHLGIRNSEISNISVEKETHNIYNFTYKGKKYEAELFVYGAIYLKREGQNPILMSFDISEFRYDGRFRTFL